jgi:outer membrane protein
MKRKPGNVVVGLLVTVSVALAAPLAGAASLVEVYGGVGLWNGAFSGPVRAGADDVEVDDDLDLGRDRHVWAYAGLEHPVPLLPNFRAQYTQIETGGQTTLSRSIEFRGTAFPVESVVDSQIELTQIDGTAYWKLWSTGVEIDVGLTVRYVDGNVAITAEGEDAQAEFDGFVPMLHAAGRFPLPLTGLWLGARLDGAAYGGDRLFDGALTAGWQSRAGLGIEAGWRLYRLEIDDRGQFDRTRIDISGPYAALNLRF